MTIAQHIVDLINADIDGEISAVEKRELEAILAIDREAQALHSQLSMICAAMDSAKAVTPPTYLKHTILEMTVPNRFKSRSPASGRRFFSAPAVRLAGAFAAGIVLALGYLGSDLVSRNSFDDVTGLVGTMTDRRADLSVKNSINVSRSDISGTVTIDRSGQILIVEFDLSSLVPIDIVAEFPGEDIWFNGFAQLESSGTSVAAEPGRVTVRTEGKRRYAVYLHDAAGREATIGLRFIAAGNVIHEAQLVTDESI
jgi:hypothetical protein